MLNLRGRNKLRWMLDDAGFGKGLKMPEISKTTDEDGNEHLSVTVTRKEGMDGIVERLEAEDWVFISVSVPCITEFIERKDGPGRIRKKPGEFRHLHFFRSKSDIEIDMDGLKERLIDELLLVHDTVESGDKVHAFGEEWEITKHIGPIFEMEHHNEITRARGGRPVSKIRVDTESRTIEPIE